MILIIDNYDSFVYNLARYVARTGKKYEVHRNDKITIEEIEKKSPTAIIISPGPCTPKEAGISIDLVKKLGHKTPILGVCLGHQAIAESYGGKTIKAEKPVHGKTDQFTHDNSTLFKNIPNPISVGRYHSLVISLPDKHDFRITGKSTNGEIMSIKHKSHPVYGVQFHPESVLTPDGLEMIKNFIEAAKIWRQKQDG